MRLREPKKAWRAALFGVLALLFTACVVEGPQSALDPRGPIARKEHNLFVPVFWIAVGVFVVVEGVLLYALVRFRGRKGQEHEAPVQTHGNKRAEFAWTIAPAILLAGIAVPTLATIFDVDREPVGALQVNVIGHQWWWEYEYPDFDFVTANELRIPVGRPVRLNMTASSVIHSFWVPQLAGKQDVIPGRFNKLTIQADEPGNYLGQCAEYCGVSHANMRLRVIAQPPGEFERWAREQQQPAAVQPAGMVGQVWNNVCIQCHSLQPNERRLGPNLAHFASRTTFGSAIYSGFASGFPEEARQEMYDWLANPQAAKPGNDMFLPRRLTDAEIRALIAFLERLK